MPRNADKTSKMGKAGNIHQPKDERNNYENHQESLNKINY